MLSYIFLLTHITHVFCVSEYASTENVFVNAYPWLFPGGIGDIYDTVRGKVQSIKSWAKHLIHYYDGRFLGDQLFTLYLFNTLQRHDNNSSGNFFFNDKNWLGSNPPSLEELKDQIRTGDFEYVSKLKYFSQGIRGSDGYWRSKTAELESWIDYHVSRNHGPPTHFITLTCAENWWPDLRQIMYQLELASEANSTTTRSTATKQSQLIKDGDFKALCRSVQKHSLYVNQYFMRRAKEFMDGYAREVLGIEHYWGRVEFASGRGQIHLHILCIAKNKAYLQDFYNASSEEEKAKVMHAYAKDMLDMTADVKVDENHQRLSVDQTTAQSPLATRFADVTDERRDAKLLAQDCMCHDCNDYCLGYKNDTHSNKCRECRFGYGTENTPNKGDTEGKELRSTCTIHKDGKGVEHLLLPRLHSRRIVQHSRSLLQAWRANADVQLLIYRSNPDMPDVGEIESVCRYVVAYAGKRYQTTRQETNMIQDIILR